MAESFFATLKTEFYTRRVWPTRATAEHDVGALIETRYNRQRRHASLDRLIPRRDQPSKPSMYGETALTSTLRHPDVDTSARHPSVRRRGDRSCAQSVVPGA
ncbi:transposase [Microbacteriaceae bacterium VKM Ac-2855]|nr:transposase [Microbacteriaceae bacterium VKM Ac-2855]